MKVERIKISEFSFVLHKVAIRSAVVVLTVLAVLAIVMPRVQHADNPVAQNNRRKKDNKASAYRDAKKAIREGKYEKSIKIYTELLGHDPVDVQAHLGLALSHSKQQNYQLSYIHTQEAIKIDRENSRAYALAGLSLLRSGYVRDAILQLNESFRLDSKEPLAWGAAAEIDYYEGRSKDSRDKALRAYTLDSEEPDFLITFARASSRIENFKEAADAYERFLEVAPENDTDRRDRIKGLIGFYRRLTGLEIHQLSGPKTADIPFKLGTDRRPYIQVRVNGNLANFVVDTGSGFTVISKEAAKKFGVGEISRGGTSQGVGGSGKFEIVYGLIRTLQAGDLRVRSIPCFIRPFHGSKERPDSERADGFIGLSVLSRFLTEIDYQNSVMRLDRSERTVTQAIAEPDTTVVPFRTTQNGLISIETELDGNHRINAILDSGASSTVISSAAVARLNMRNSIIKGQTVRVVGAAGISENVELLFLRNCKVADLQQNNLRALVLDFNAINETSGFEQSGILGGDFLRHFRVTIDFTRGELALQPHTAAVTRH
jgi:Flp pilus assembly protein TadD/predicted aspartyl protease